MKARWKPIYAAPTDVPLITCRAGEKGINRCIRVKRPGEPDEFIASDGRTTVAHSTFLPPTHFLCICPPIPK